MTLQETAKLLTIISSMYPNFKVTNKDEALRAWHFALDEYDYNLISEALKIYIKTSGSSFAPSVSELIAMTHKVDELTQISDQEAWVLVRRALSRGTYYAKEEFDKLPPLVQKAVGAPDQLHNWATSDMHTIETVVASNFMRNYSTIVKRDSEIKMLPTETRARLENLQRLALEGGTDNE